MMKSLSANFTGIVVIPTLTAEVIVMVTLLEVEVGEEVVLDDMMGIGIDTGMVS